MQWNAGIINKVFYSDSYFVYKRHTLNQTLVAETNGSYTDAKNGSASYLKKNCLLLFLFFRSQFNFTVLKKTNFVKTKGCQSHRWLRSISWL